MKISEIFRSIQGESYLAGRPCTLVRLAGCNLNCPWC
ncbi:MAG: 7-carboxy-7-deazaguanine synthase, partial [Planctomycetota bacterium]